MALTLESLAAEMRPFHNDICIVHDLRMGRLLGVCETEEDFYYVVHLITEEAPGLFSAVGPCVSLKPTYPVEDYARLEQIFALNRVPASETFLVKMEP